MDVKLLDDLETRFTYHPPRGGDQVHAYAVIRGQAKDFAGTLLELCPESQELSIAITKLEEAAFWANAAIARRT